jgi:hypothetical protein
VLKCLGRRTVNYKLFGYTALCSNYMSLATKHVCVCVCVCVCARARVLDKIFLHSIQTGCGSHPTSHPIGTGGDLPVGKAAGT